MQPSQALAGFFFDFCSLLFFVVVFLPAVNNIMKCCCVVLFHAQSFLILALEVSQ